MRAVDVSTLVLVFCGVLAPVAAFAAEAEAKAFNLHPGEALTFTARVADGAVALGPPRLSRLGAAQPRDGEISVGLSKRDATLHEEVTVTEKTPAPIDFLATAMVGETKIDEAVMCGQPGGIASSHIGAISWRVSLHDFEARKPGATCE